MTWRTALETHLLAEVEYLKQRLAIAEAKCERMELALMPLTPAGQRYATPITVTRPATLDELRDEGKDLHIMGRWSSLQAQNAREIEEEAKRDHAMGQKARSTAQPDVGAQAATDAAKAERSA